MEQRVGERAQMNTEKKKPCRGHGRGRAASCRAATTKNRDESRRSQHFLWTRECVSRQRHHKSWHAISWATAQCHQYWEAKKTMASLSKRQHQTSSACRLLPDPATRARQKLHFSPSLGCGKGSSGNSAGGWTVNTYTLRAAVPDGERKRVRGKERGGRRSGRPPLDTLGCFGRVQ